MNDIPLANVQIQSQLKPGDCLLYQPSSIYGWIIRLKTWHPVSHVEVYAGDGQSWASRDGVGVGQYPLRLKDLYKVLRPTQPLDLGAMAKLAAELDGTPYGWKDLLAFTGLKHNFKGIVCSPYACRLYKVGGLSLFGAEPCHFIAPFQFETTPLLEDTHIV